MKSKRILIIIPFIDEVPLRGYEVLLSNHIKKLSKLFDIDLVCLNNLDNRTTSFSHSNTILHPVKLSLFDKLLGLFICLFELIPFQSAPFVNPKFKNTINNLLRLNKFDHVICYMSRTFPAINQKELQGNKKLPISVYAIDPLALSYKKISSKTKNIISLAYLIEGWLIKRLDQNIIDGNHGFALISESDKKEYINFLGISKKDSIYTVPYGVDGEREELFFDKRIAGRVIVTGSGNYKPNQDALKYVLQKVWPLFDDNPALHLVIAGSGYSKEILRLAKPFKSVKFLGFVDDIKYELRRSSYALCLVDLEFGVQTKVLEAMSSGTPTICSSASNKGIAGIDGLHLLIADKPDEVLACFNRFEEDPNLSQLISQNSRKFIYLNFSWNKSAEKLINFITKKEPEGNC